MAGLLTYTLIQMWLPGRSKTATSKETDVGNWNLLARVSATTMEHS
jgi:hypothetical protein